MKTILTFAFAALTTLAATSDQAAARSAEMPTTGTTSQPIGHYEFCKRYPSECQAQTAYRPLKMNNALWKLLVDINDSVNASIFPREDIAIHGQPDVWSYPSVEGDCEDYALLKQYMLEQAGIPSSNLLITVVLQSNGEGHAVLAVRTDRGDLILDNLVTKVRPWYETEYFYLKRQSAQNAGKWVGISDDRNLLVGSVR